jgi:NAD(P)H dehydrogenase (quinone)
VKVYVVYCHPDPESFTAAVLHRTTAALEAAGHQVRMSDLYSDDFDAALSLQERLDHLIPSAPNLAIAGYCLNLQWCDALVFIYPTWWSAQPAMLTGWLDRVLVRGVAWELPDGATRITPRLTNVRRLVTITTHGSSKWINILEGQTGRRVIGRAVRVLCHRSARTTWLAMYDIDRSTAAQRMAFLDRVEHQMHRLWSSPTSPKSPSSVAGRRS